MQLDASRRLAYPGAAPDRKVRRYVPPVRLVKTDGRVENAEALIPAEPVIQSFLHFNPPRAVLYPGASVLFDFGVELHGGVRIVTAVNEIRTQRAELVFGESVSETLGEPTPDHAVHKTMLELPPLGMAEFGNTAFRFVRLALPADAPAPLELMGVTAVANYLDLRYVGDFRSSDERLNAIWRTAAYTVHLNMQDYIYDGVKRDRLVWMGDLYPEVRVVAAVFDDNELVEKSLDFSDLHTPDGHWMNGISSYTCWWVICQRDWYLWRGDRAYLERQRQALRRHLALLLAAVGEDGAERMPEVRFLDWPNADDKAATGAGLQGLLAWSLAAGADLCAELGEDALAAECRAKAALLCQAPPPVGLNKTAAAMQVLGGMREPRSAEAEVFSRDPFRGVSTFYGYFVLLARARGAAMAEVLEVIRRYWGGMLDAGATTFWEDFDLEWTRDSNRIDELPQPGKRDLHADFGNYCYVGLRHSLCHGWSGGPAAFLSEKVLGVTPLAAGFSRFSFAPELGDLAWAEGEVPTPRGGIRVRVEAGRGAELEVPAGCVAVLADGRELGPGRHQGVKID